MYFTTFQSKNKLYMEISLSKYVFSPSDVNSLEIKLTHLENFNLMDR